MSGHIQVPYDPGVLYHYCSAQAFQAIVSSRSIRLSMLSLSNDSQEGRLVEKVFARLSEAERMAQGPREILLGSLEQLRTSLEGLGFCLSEEGDLLSQWRGYADDGNGVAIGFSYKYLQSLRDKRAARDESHFGILQVEYDEAAHERILKPTFDEVRKLVSDGALSYAGRKGLLDTRSDDEVEGDQRRVASLNQAVSLKLLPLLEQMYRLKGIAFREEDEWRLFSVLLSEESGESYGYRAGRDRILPFREVPLEATGVDVLANVILGPKHVTPVSIVQRFLANNGFLGVPVERSTASYR